MNEELHRRFVALLELQLTGDASVIQDVKDLDVSLKDGCCLSTVYGQWCGAFSYSPGRLEALEPILRLAHMLPRWKSDNPAYLFKQPEWAKLIELRGPAESVEIRRCENCDRAQPVMRISPFLAMVGLACPACGRVHFRSEYDHSPAPTCVCGETCGEPFPGECLHCGGPGNRHRIMSPYEYFDQHNYTMER